MAKRKLRLLKRGQPMIGICEGCLAQFKSMFNGAIAAEAEIRVRFAAHKCMHAHPSANKMHAVATTNLETRGTEKPRTSSTHI